ncbi:MAG: helix-turn-helix domain-containing protein [Flavobacteriales bacterium]|nr:helix-turn-helix domain-containing protein [Flavobacteriales bacterium]
MGTFFSQNLKTLRRVKGLSQDGMATVLSLKRTTVSSYENGMSEPNIDILERIASFFSVTLDTLLRDDFSRYSDEQISVMMSSGGIDVSGKSLRVLVTTVSDDNEENVEIVPVSAQAGYTTGYADPEWVASLPHMSLPFLSPNKKYRAFPIKGDSMPPVASGSYVIGEYVVNWQGVRDGQYAVVVTAEDGIVFKKVFPDLKRGVLLLVSTNPAYQPYEIPLQNVLEVWSFVSYVAQTIMETAISQDQMQDTVNQLLRDVSILKNKIGV